MPPPHLYSDFMYFIQNTLAIRDASSNYKFHSIIIKNLISEFEFRQHSRIGKEKKLLVETINQIHINRWTKDRLSLNSGYQFYIEWGLINTCGVRVFLNESYEDIKSEYGIPKLTMKIHLSNIGHPL